MAQRQDSLFGWVHGPDPIGNAIAFAACAVVLLILSPIIIMFVLSCAFWLNETPNASKAGCQGGDNNSVM